MAQTPKGRLVLGFYIPMHGTCAMYFYLGVNYSAVPLVSAPGTRDFHRFGRLDENSWRVSTLCQTPRDPIFLGGDFFDVIQMDLVSAIFSAVASLRFVRR